MNVARRFSLLILSLFLLSTVLPAQQKPRKRVAVVLSGGGAKGMAHIGALRVIERAGIPG
jgi:NTE family protein